MYVGASQGNPLLVGSCANCCKKTLQEHLSDPATARLVHLAQLVLHLGALSFLLYNQHLSQKLRMHYDGVEGGAGQNATQGTRTDNRQKLCSGSCSSDILLREACRTPANTVAARRLMAVMLDQCANHFFSFSFLLFSTCRQR